MQPNQQQPGYPGNPSQQSGYPGQMQPRGPPNMAQGPPRPPGQFGSQPPRPGMGAPPGSQPPRPGMIPPPGSQPRPGMGAPMQPRGPPSMGAPPGSQPPRPGMGAPMQPRGQPAMGAPQPPRPGMGAPQGSQPPRPGMNPPPGSQPRPGMGAPMQPRGPPSMGAPQGSQPPRPGMGAPMQPRGPPSMGAPQGSQPPRPGMGAPMQPRGPPTMGAPPGSQPPRPGMGAPMQPRGPPAMGAPSGPAMGMPPAMGAPNQQGGFQQAPRGYPPAGVPQQQQQPVNLDPSAQCPDWYTKMTVNKFPASKTLAQQCKVPIGALIRPLAKSPDGEEIPTVYYGNIGVQRCKSCRAYINPFVQWIENGRRWRCNICGLIDDTKSQYYSHLDASGQRADRNERAELSKGIYEIVAPQDYMIRPPQSPVYVFVIDVSDQAVKSGMLHVACDAIKKSLDHLPGAPRTQVAVITYDYAIHFYNLRSNLTQPQMMVVSDLEDVFVPLPEDLLVNLAESRQQVEDLLTALPTMHANNHGMETAFGCAIMAAYRVMAHIGGKMCVFQSKLPVIGEGKLQPRAQPGVVGSDKEHTFLQQAGNFYKSRAVEFIRVHICVELFLFPHNYCDVSTLQTLPKYTGGQLHYFPRFNASRDGESFFHALHRTLSRDNGWEAVMRVRASRGVHVASNAFYGNVVVRGTDLLSLPNIDEDMTFGVEFTHEEAVVPTGTVTIQGALLYTNSAGERRIRVSTLCLPVATQAADVLQSSNQDAVAVLYGKMTVDRLLSDGLDAARKQLQKLCVDIIRAVQTGYGGAYGGGGASYPGGPPQMQMQQQQQQRPNLPPSLNLLPLYIMALIKNPVFRGGSDISLDERAFAIHRFCRVSLKLAMVLLYPNFYPMHSMAEDCGRLVAVPKDDAGVPAKPSEDPADILRIDDQRVKLPAVTGLSGERLQSDGYFLLDTGYTLYMWIGRAVPPATLQSLFGLASLEGIDSGVLKLEPTETDDELKKRVLNIVRAIQKSREVFAPLIFVKEGDTYTEPKFYSYLVEDRASFPGGAFNYGEFFQQVMRLAH